MSKKDILTAFILDELVTSRDVKSLDENDPLLESGIIDSLAIMKLLAFIETQFKVNVSDGELMPENFNTIASIVKLLENHNPRKLSDP
jgi:acyl carrier protein